MSSSSNGVTDSMSYVVIRNGKTVQHFVMIGDPKKKLDRPSKLVDISFDTLEAANEVARAIDAEVKKIA
jgi:hypothetical protein